MFKSAIIIAYFLALATGDEEVFTGASSKFAGKLFQKTIEGRPGNVIVSPYSIQKSLTMSMLGAAGKTQSEMKHALNYDEISDSDISGIYSQISQDLKGYKTLKSANKFYVMNKYSLKPSYKNLALGSFDSEIENINFVNREAAANTINQWIEEKTNNKIKNIVKPETLDSTIRLVIVNAVHFKDQWKIKFDPAKTYKSKFFLDDSNFVETDFMTVRGKFATTYNQELHSMVVDIPYKEPETSMLVILPIHKTGLADVEKKIDNIDWNTFGRDMHSGQMFIELPKFKFEFEIELNKALSDMGMKKAFTDSAEFPNIIDSREELFISQVIHKAFVAVSEEGTEAAAATVQSMKFKSGPMMFRANHPFLFVIKFKSQVIFMGRFVNPA